MDMIAPVGSAAATRPLPLFGDGGLSIGQIIHARVAKVDGDMVQLRWDDQSVSVASKVPLTLGQQVSLVVEEGSPGKLVLRMMDEIFGQGRPTRTQTPGTGRGTTTASGTTGTTGSLPGGRQIPVIVVQGRPEGEAGESPGGQFLGGGEPESGGPGGQAVRGGGLPGQARPNGTTIPQAGPGTTGFGATGAGSFAAAGPSGFGATGPTGYGAPGAGSPGTTGPTGYAAPGASRPGTTSPTGYGAPGAGSFGTASPTGFRGPGASTPGAPGSGGNGTSGPNVSPGAGGPGTSPEAFGGATNTVNGLWRAGANDGRIGLPGNGTSGTNGAAPAGATAPGANPAQPGSNGVAGAPRGEGPGTPETWTPGTTGTWTQGTSSTWAQGRPGSTPTAPEQDPMASVFFEKLDGAATRLAGSGRARTSDLPSGATTPRIAAAPRTPIEPTPPGHEHVARAAMPAYGRLAQSVGGAVAFGQLLAALPRAVGETLARAPLAPADLGRLLIDVGVHPDEMNAVLVGEMLAQGVPVQEGTVRALRRELAVAGGTPRDAAATVALSRLGLPVTPLSLAIARQMLAGQLDPASAWGDLLPELQRLARFSGRGSQAGAVAAELLADWQVPVSDGAEAVSEWLRTTVDQAGTPLEAKLARSLLADAESQPATSPGHDIRARLDLLSQALPESVRENRSEFGQSLQRLQATVQAEQLLNGSATDRPEPRFFAVTLPTVIQRQTGTLQMRVRERDARPRAIGETARPDIVHLKLSLPGLGELGVNLTVGQQSVACHFAAGSTFAEALLNASSSELVGRLKRLGYTHTAVDTAHEQPDLALSNAGPLVAAPRVSHVDLHA